MTVAVESELSSEEMLDIAAASTAAMNRPGMMIGSSPSTKAGMM